MKNDIDSLLNSIFSNGKLNLNNPVKRKDLSMDELLRRNMEDIAAVNASVRKEMEQMDAELKADGLSETKTAEKQSDPAGIGVFETLEAELSKEIIGQDGFVRSPICWATRGMPLLP